MNQHVVVYDPEHRVHPGTVSVSARHANMMAAKGIVLLAVDPNRVNDVPGGYFHRHWGDGWVFDRGGGERGCPMILETWPSRLAIAWAVGLTGTAGSGYSGDLKLVTDSSRGFQSGALGTVKRPPSLSHLQTEPGDLVVVGGISTLGIESRGVLVLTLYAVAKGVVVLWTACTVVEEGEAGFMNVASVAV